MSHTLETLMYQTGQVFLIPTLAVIAILFLYAFLLRRCRRRRLRRCRCRKPRYLPERRPDWLCKQ